MVRPSRVGLLAVATIASALLVAAPAAEASTQGVSAQSCVASPPGATPVTTCPTTPSASPTTTSSASTTTTTTSQATPTSEKAPNAPSANRRVVPGNDAPTPKRAGRPAGDRDCADFATQQQAQRYFESIGGSATNNADRLDANGNGIACESLADDGDNQDAEATATGDDGSTAKTSGDQVTEVPEGSAQTGGA